MTAKVAFIGLGVMGYPMAGHLAQAGHEVNVFNRSAATAQKWSQKYHGKAYKSPAEAAQGCEFVFTCVSKDDDLYQVTLEQDGIFQSLGPEAVLVDHSTTSADTAIKLGQLAEEKNSYFIDAPVSGGQQGAINGQLTIMCGGNENAFKRAQVIMASYGKAITLMGVQGSGQRTKMVNQIAIAGLIQGLAEGLHFAQQAGLDEQQVIDVISKGAAQSWQMDNRHQTMIEGFYEHGFAVDLMRKDLAICLDQARKINAKLPVTALVDQFYADVQNMGGGKWDTSSLLKRLKR